MFADYDAYNDRNLDIALSRLHPNIRWDNGEGEMLSGTEAVALHWREQWRKGDAKVYINSIAWEDMKLVLSVTLEAKEPSGLATSHSVRNSIGFVDDLIASMQIE